MISKLKTRMLLLYLKNRKCKMSIIVFIAEEICSWMSPWLAEKTEMLSVCGKVTARKIFLQHAVRKSIKLGKIAPQQTLISIQSRECHT